MICVASKIGALLFFFLLEVQRGLDDSNSIGQHQVRSYRMSNDMILVISDFSF